MLIKLLFLIILHHSVLAIKDEQSVNFPWLASINIDDSHRCSGVVIDHRIILTTASCVIDCKIGKLIDPKRVVATYATDMLKPWVHDYSVKNISIHENYNCNPPEKSPKHTFDIAIIQLNLAIGEKVYSSKTSPILILDDRKLDNKTHSNLVVYGSCAGEFHFLPLMMKRSNMEDLTLNMITRDSMILVADEDGSKNTCCIPDQGSPIVKFRQDKNATPYLVGIQFYANCKRQNYVFTRLSYYIDWLQQKHPELKGKFIEV